MCKKVRQKSIRGMNGHLALQYDWYINPYYWVSDHPLLHGNSGSLEPDSYKSGKGNIWHQEGGCVATYLQELPKFSGING